MRCFKKIDTAYKQEDCVNNTAYSTGSKIYKTASSYFAVAGYIPLTFDVHIVIDSSIKAAANTSTAITTLKHAIASKLRTDLLQQQKYKPQFYNANNPDYRNSILSIALVGMENNAPYFYILNFTLADMTKTDIGVQEINSSKNKTEQVYILGHNKAANQYFLSHQKVTNPLQYVVTLIQVQMFATPKAVGLPVRAIHIQPSDIKNYTIK